MMAAALTAGTTASTAFSPDTLSLGEVNVNAVAPTPALDPLTVTNVSVETIDKSAETSVLPVLSTRIPSFFVTERGFAGYGVSGGSAGEVVIRGIGGGNKVLFLIDGMPQWAGIYGHSLPDTYVSNGIEEIQVVRGPSSLLYGSGAMGGSVNLITRKRQQDGFGLRLHVMGGSFSTQKYQLGVNYKDGPWSVNVGGMFDKSNGNRKGSKFWLGNEYANIACEINPHWSTGVMIDATQTLAHNPGTTDEPLVDMWTHVARLTGAWYLNNKYSWGDGSVKAFYNWGRHRVDDGHSPDAAPRDYYFLLKDYNAGFSITENFYPWQGSILTGGVDFKQWGGHAWNEIRATGKEEDIIDDHENEVGVFALLQQGFFNERLTLNAGLRADHGSQYGWEMVPQAGFSAKLWKGSDFKFSFGKGFRAPNLRELYLYRPANPDLDPEKMLNYEVELRQKALDGRLDMGLAVYFANADNLIQTGIVEGRPINLNTGKTINKGIEFDASFTLNDTWSFYANYGYLHTSTQLIGSPRHKLNVEGTWSWRGFKVNPQFQFVDHLATATSGDNFSTYGLINLRLSWHWLFLKMENLADRHYEIIHGCPMPGFTIMGGIQISF